MRKTNMETIKMSSTEASSLLVSVRSQTSPYCKLPHNNKDKRNKLTTTEVRLLCACYIPYLVWHVWATHASTPSRIMALILLMFPLGAMRFRYLWLPFAYLVSAPFTLCDKLFVGELPAGILPTLLGFFYLFACTGDMV